MPLIRKKPPNKDELLRCLYYLNGELIWIGHNGRSRVKLGTVAGHLNKSTGYQHVTFNGIIYPVHHIVWFMHYGTWPDYVDHKDKDTLNNKIENLREATSQQNNANARLRKDNTLGLKGVSRWGNKYRAQIQVDKKKIYLGLYDTPNQAHEAFVQASRKFNGEFSCL